jgi:hypothetical protein
MDMSMDKHKHPLGLFQGIMRFIIYRYELHRSMSSMTLTFIKNIGWLKTSVGYKNIGWL